MTHAQRRAFYSSKEWRLASLKCREAAAFLCQRCKAQGLTEGAVLTHHRKAVSNGGSKWAKENHEALCQILP